MLNIPGNTGQDQQQQMPTQTPHLTQSPQATSAEKTEATTLMLPPGPHRPLTPHMPLPASPTSSSWSSAPLFTEDKYSSTSEEESEADAEVTFIHGRSNSTFANHQAERPTSTPTSDYTTQGDPDASPSNLFRSNVTNDEFLGTNNFFVPDGSNRRIHQIDKVFHAGYLENGNNAYLLELPALEKMLNMWKFLMDEMSGQFYAVYGNSYQWMSMKPMLQQAWATGELINELAATRQAFGYTGLAGSTPPLATRMQPTASMSCQPDDLLPRQPAPKTVQYQPPSFKLTRLTTHLMMNERIQVHHNYISAVSSLEHKKDLINRLKRSDTHNISSYEAEMSRHMTLHEDVLERILNILKQDDYYRTLEELPVIDDLTAYDDIRLFPELYDTSTIIERITGKADLIERQLRRLGMYPQPTNLSPSTSTSAPKPTSIFEPSSTSKQSTESSPQSLLPCGQRTPAASTSSSDAPSSHTPPQPFVHSQHQPKIPTPTQHTSPKPHKQQIQQTPVKTNANQPTQPSISDEEQQRIPKSTNNSQVKNIKQQLRQQDECLCFYCNQLGHLKRSCPKIPYCSKCRTRGHTLDRYTSKPQRNRHPHQTGESRDQQKRNEDLPQFSSRHNRCLHCAGDHQTANCTTTRQRQTPTTNSPASGTGTSIHQNAPSTSHSSSHPNSQSPATHSQSTLHVQTPTLNINAPPFPSNLHQAPPPPLAQNNQSTNYNTN